MNNAGVGFGRSVDETYDATHALLCDGTCASVSSKEIPTPMHPSFVARSGADTTAVNALPWRTGTMVVVVNGLLPQAAPGGAWAVLRDPTGVAYAALSKRGEQACCLLRTRVPLIAMPSRGVP